MQKCTLSKSKVWNNIQPLVFVICVIVNEYSVRVHSSVRKVFLEQVDINVWAERHRTVKTIYCSLNSRLYIEYSEIPGRNDITIGQIHGFQGCLVSIVVHLIKDYKRERTLCLYRDSISGSLFDEDVKVRMMGVKLELAEIQEKSKPLFGFVTGEPNSVVKGYYVNGSFFGSIRLFDKLRLYHEVFYIEPRSNVQLYSARYINGTLYQRHVKDNAVLFEYVSTIQDAEWEHCTPSLPTPITSTTKNTNTTSTMKNTSTTSTLTTYTTSTPKHPPNDSTTVDKVLMHSTIFPPLPTTTPLFYHSTQASTRNAYDSHSSLVTTQMPPSHSTVVPTGPTSPELYHSTQITARLSPMSSSMGKTTAGSAPKISIFSQPTPPASNYTWSTEVTTLFNKETVHFTEVPRVAISDNATVYIEYENGTKIVLNAKLHSENLTNVEFKTHQFQLMPKVKEFVKVFLNNGSLLTSGRISALTNDSILIEFMDTLSVLYSTSPHHSTTVPTVQLLEHSTDFTYDTNFKGHSTVLYMNLPADHSRPSLDSNITMKPAAKEQHSTIQEWGPRHSTPQRLDQTRFTSLAATISPLSLIHSTDATTRPTSREHYTEVTRKITFSPPETKKTMFIEVFASAKLVRSTLQTAAPQFYHSTQAAAPLLLTTRATTANLPTNSTKSYSNGTSVKPVTPFKVTSPKPLTAFNAISSISTSKKYTTAYSLPINATNNSNLQGSTNAIRRVSLLRVTIARSNLTITSLSSKKVNTTDKPTTAIYIESRNTSIKVNDSLLHSFKPSTVVKNSYETVTFPKNFRASTPVLLPGEKEDKPAGVFEASTEGKRIDLSTERRLLATATNPKIYAVTTAPLLKMPNQVTTLRPATYKGEEDNHTKKKPKRRRKRNALFDFEAFFGDNTVKKSIDNDAYRLINVLEEYENNLNIFDLRSSNNYICNLCVWIQPHFAESFSLGSGNLVVGISEILDMISLLDWAFRVIDFNNDGIPENIGFRVKQLVVGDDVDFEVASAKSKRSLRSKRQGNVDDQILDANYGNFDGQPTEEGRAANTTGGSASALVVGNVLSNKNETQTSLPAGPYRRTPLKLNVTIALRTARDSLNMPSCCAILGFVYHEMAPLIAAASKNGLCSTQNVGLISGMVHGNKLTKHDVFRGVMHALGHLFGADHNRFTDPECVNQPYNEFLNPFVMDPIQRQNMGGRFNSMRFSSCAKDDITLFLSSPMPRCIIAEEEEAFCGNGVLDDGEACDCGSPWSCNSGYPCCAERGTALECKIIDPNKKSCFPAKSW